MATPDPSYLQELAARYTAAWCSQNPAAVSAFYAANGSLRVNDSPPAVGRAAIAEVARLFMAAFPDLHVMMDEITVDERPVYRWTLTGTNTGPGGTGRKVRLSGYEEWRLGPDGLIAESHGHFDSIDYQRQLAGGERDAISPR